MFGKHTKIVHWCPFIVSIKQRVGNITRQCGGSILTQTLTLTAAHCLINGIQNMNLRFGSSNLFHGGTLIAATSSIIHNSFEWDTLASDIGLVSIFPTFLEYSDKILPVRLAKNFAVLEPSKQIIVYGWGAMSLYQNFSILLRSAILPVVEQEECRSLIKGTLPNGTFCLGYKDGHLDACEGDSGGPALLDGVQVGITSFGEGCGLPLKPGVYTNVIEFLDWIYFNMLTQL